MSASAGLPSIHVLLIEHDGLVRSTMASACRELNIVRIHQATTLGQGEQWLRVSPADGLILSLADPQAALQLLARVRAGEFLCQPGIAVAAMAPACDASVLQRLKELDVRRFLLQPFKLRDVIQTVEQLWPAREKSTV